MSPVDDLLLSLADAAEEGATVPFVSLVVGAMVLVGAPISRAEYLSAMRNHARVLPEAARKTLEAMLDGLPAGDGALYLESTPSNIKAPEYWCVRIADVQAVRLSS